MKKLCIPLLIASFPFAVNAVEMQTFDKYGNEIFQQDSQFPMKHVGDILTDEEIQVYAAISSRLILDRADLKGYASDIGISNDAASAFYITSKTMKDKANMQWKKQFHAFCDQLLNTTFSDSVTKSDIEPLNKQASTVNAISYTVISEELQKLKSDYPKEYQRLLDTHSGDFSVAYQELDFEQVTASNWIEHYTNQCNSLGGS